MPCFENVDVNIVMQKFRDRFFEKRSENDFIKIVDDLIYASYNNFWTKKYDTYQKLTNGILP
jgi:phosphatidylinositol kinase/protein kinase (PI-3  family)